MATLPRISALAGIVLLSLSEPSPLRAQEGAIPPRARTNPTVTPGQLGAMSSPQRFLVTSSANERGTFLWVIDAVEHTATLCEKAVSAAEFICNKKPLP
jgi:hypothetical protein